MAKIKVGLSGPILTGPVVRLSYPSLFVATKNDDDPADKKPKYGAAFLFPLKPAETYKRLGLPEGFTNSYKSVLDAIKLSCLKLAVEAYGGKDSIPEEILAQGLRKGNGWPFRDQRQKEGDGYEPGALFINCSSTRKPQVIDQARRRILTMTDPLREELGKAGVLSPKNSEHIYAGCWVRPSVHAYTYSNKGNEGISLGLDNVQLVCDDTPLGGGGGNVNEQFDAIDFGYGAPDDDSLADLLG